MLTSINCYIFRICFITISWTCFLNNAVGSAFVDRSAKLLLDWTYLISIFFSLHKVLSVWEESCIYMFCAITLDVLFLHSCETSCIILIDHNWTFLACLVHKKLNWVVLDLNHMHSLLATCRVITSAWFDDVATSVCFCERHEIAIPSIKNV